jgi:hypothetical protein
MERLNMKKIVFPFLGVLMFLFSGCLKIKPSVSKYTNVPAIVTFDFDVPATVLVTPLGTFYTSELPSEYSDGDMIWIDFTYDEGNQPYSNVASASELEIHDRISRTEVKGVAKEEMSDDYNVPISRLFINPVNIGKTIFLGLVQQAPSGQVFEYEALYDLDETPSTPPALCIRSRKVNEVTGSETKVSTMIGFDMSSFLTTFQDTDGYTRFYVKYLTGTENGEDVYTNLTSSPFLWKAE